MAGLLRHVDDFLDSFAVRGFDVRSGCLAEADMAVADLHEGDTAHVGGGRGGHGRVQAQGAGEAARDGSKRARTRLGHALQEAATVSPALVMVACGVRSCLPCLEGGPAGLYSRLK